MTPASGTCKSRAAKGAAAGADRTDLPIAVVADGNFGHQPARRFSTRAALVSAGFMLGGAAFKVLPELPLPLADLLRPHLTTGDLNGDGLIDLVAECRLPTMCVLLGRGDGTFQLAAHYFFGNGRRIFIADIDGDGRDDLITLPYGYSGRWIVGVMTNVSQ